MAGCSAPADTLHKKKLMLRRTRKLPGWTRSACEQVRDLASAGPLDRNRASSLADVHQKLAGECAIPVYEAGGWCTLGPQGCLPWRWLIAHAHPALGTVGSALLPKLGRRYSFSIHTLDFRREQKKDAGGTPVGNGTYLTLPLRTQGRYSLLSMYHGRR